MKSSCGTHYLSLIVSRGKNILGDILNIEILGHVWNYVKIPQVLHDTLHCFGSPPSPGFVEQTTEHNKAQQRSECLQELKQGIGVEIEARTDHSHTTNTNSSQYFTSACEEFVCVLCFTRVQSQTPGCTSSVVKTVSSQSMTLIALAFAVITFV